jgi:hypothetical protein
VAECEKAGLQRTALLSHVVRKDLEALGVHADVRAYYEPSPRFEVRLPTYDDEMRLFALLSSVRKAIMGMEGAAESLRSGALPRPKLCLEVFYE